MEKIISMELHGKIAIVTGGKRLGVAVAEMLAARGVNLVLSYRNSRKEAEKTAAACRKFGVEAVTVRADVSKESDVKKLFGFAKKKFTRTDFLIHMASTFDETPWGKLDAAVWNREMGNNLTSAFLCAKAAGDIMLKQKSGGKIIFIGDTRASKPYAGRLPYLTAKAALPALAKILAAELAPKVTVNCVAPGMILPLGQSSKHLAKIKKNTLLQRFGTPQEIAHAICFLLENDFVNGHTLVVDGGS